MNRLRVATTGLLLVLAGSVAAQVQPATNARPSATIAGVVELAEGGARMPLRRATVRLRNNFGQPEQVTATDKDGRYQFENLAAGTYGVVVEKAGFLAESAGETTVAAAATVVVSFRTQRAGAIEGRVIEASGKPMAALKITVDRVPDGADQSAQSKSYAGKTDDLGRFRVHTLPPGRYRISIGQSSDGRYFYPGTDNPADAAILTVAAGETAGGLIFAIPNASISAVAAEMSATLELETQSAPTRGGSWGQISGRVLRSDNGQPIANAAVRLSSSSGGALLRTVWTDGAGEYTLSRVVPGAYVLAAAAQGFANPAAAIRDPRSGGTKISVSDGEKAKSDFLLVALSAIEGTVVDEFGDPAPGIVLRVAVNRPNIEPMDLQAAMIAVDPTDDRGTFRVGGLLPADYYLFAIPEPFARSGPATFPIMYFPGATSFTGATPIPLGAGNDAHGVNLALPASASTALTGTVADTTGRRISKAIVGLSPVHDGPFKGAFRASAVTDVNGRFVFPNVPAGTYVLQTEAPGSVGIASMSVTAPAAPVVVALQPVPTVRGQLVSKDGSSFARLDSLGLVRLQLVDATVSWVRGPVVPGTPMSNGTFNLPGYGTGLIRLREDAAAFFGWGLERVLLHGRDITDLPYDFSAGDLDGLEVVITNKVGSVSGTVNIQTPNEVEVILFGAEGDSWPYLSRTLRVDLVSEAGTFTFKGLVPGRYFAAAIRRGTARSNAEALLALRTLATLLVVSEGVNPGINLTIVK